MTENTPSVMRMPSYDILLNSIAHPYLTYKDLAIFDVAISNHEVRDIYGLCNVRDRSLYSNFYNSLYTGNQPHHLNISPKSLRTFEWIGKRNIRLNYIKMTKFPASNTDFVYPGPFGTTFDPFNYVKRLEASVHIVENNDFVKRFHSVEHLGITKLNPTLLENLIVQFKMNATRQAVDGVGPSHVRHLNLFANFDETISENLVIECIQATPQVVTCPIKRAGITKDLITAVGQHWRCLTDFTMQWENTDTIAEGYDAITQSFQSMTLTTWFFNDDDDQSFEDCLNRFLPYSKHSLTKLSITSLRKPFKTASLDIIYTMERLERFHLEDLSYPQDVLIKVASAMPFLTYLHVASLNNFEVPDAEIEALTTRCTRLETLQLVSYIVTRESLRSIAEAYKETLTRMQSFRTDAVDRNDYAEIFAICKKTVFIPGISTN